MFSKIYPRAFTSSCTDTLTRQRNRDMDPSSTSDQEQWFPLLELPEELRSLVYRHALGHALPKTILPRWMEGIQQLHEYTVEHSIATKRFVASLFVNLQLFLLSSLSRSFSYPLRGLPSSFIVAPSHASFLEACLMSWHPTLDIQDKSYTHRIPSVALKANWDGYDWAPVRKFSWLLPDTSNGLPQGPIISPWGFYAIRGGEILAFSDRRPLLLTPRRNL